MRPPGIGPAAMLPRVLQRLAHDGTVRRFPPQQLQQLGEVRRHAAGLVADLTDGLEARQSQRELPGANERRGLGDSGEIGSALVLFVDQHHVDLNFGDIHR
jgi:hypothetical protein